MEPTDDPQLRNLLREWKVPDAPPPLDRRVLKGREPWWSFLLTGSIRVPVPVGIAISVLFLVLIALLVRQRPAPVTAPVSLTDFQPAQNLNVRIIRSSYDAK